MGVLTPNVGPLSSTIYESAKWTAAGSFAAVRTVVDVDEWRY
jgi:hypothetical protein